LCRQNVKNQTKLTPPLQQLNLAEGANAPGRRFLTVTKDLGSSGQKLPALDQHRAGVDQLGPRLQGAESRSCHHPQCIQFYQNGGPWLSAMVTAPLGRQVVPAETTERNVDFLSLYNKEAVVGRCRQGEQTLLQAGGHLRGREGYG